MDTWTLKGMNFQTRNSFAICEVGDFEDIGDPNIGSCYQDALYFYLNTFIRQYFLLYTTYWKVIMSKGLFFYKK